MCVYHLSPISIQTCRLQPLSHSTSDYNSDDRKMPCVFVFSLSSRVLLTSPLVVMKPVCVYGRVCVGVFV